MAQAAKGKASTGLQARGARSDAARLLRALAVSPDPDWTRCMGNGARWLTQRESEVGACHGGPSAGVRALLGDEALLRALSQWCAGRVAQGDVEMLRVIPAAITGARGCARDAWEIAAREGQAMLDRVGDQSEGLSRLMARDVPTAELVQTEGTDRPADRVPPEGGGG